MAVLPSNDRHIYSSFLPDEAAGIGPASGCRISSRNEKKIASGVTVAWLNVEQSAPTAFDQ
ncbi:hypothetical protein A2U01_0031872 [Trifolium medium]|uniref:Uncharacterized protein n=1 Tax=Trifolium medium TaxID=97028 RepID=A0A392PGM0_9FABA|nr:hypothetical protein [Trifolium medium]